MGVSVRVRDGTLGDRVCAGEARGINTATSRSDVGVNKKEDFSERE
jgi:hypothetical protein